MTPLASFKINDVLSLRILSELRPRKHSAPARSRRSSIFIGVLLLAMSHVLHAQTSHVVETLGATTAQQASNGLGFNLDPANEWEFQMAAAAGATTVRFQCSWVSVESQSAPPANTNLEKKYTLPSDCQSGLLFSRKYSMRPTVVAAYGSPFHELLQVSVAGGAKAGAKTLNIQFASGVNGTGLNKIAYPNDTIIASSGNQITKIHSYAGGLITSVRQTDATHAVLTLASALRADLPSSPGTLYTINEYLYPPAATFSPTDPSNIAFANYAEFLASSIANEGITGQVEIWNEPPWPDDPWDERADFYDVFPGTSTTIPQPFMPNFGFVAVLQNHVSVPGVTYVWGGTEKSGASSLFNWMHMNTGSSLVQPAMVVTAESMHPYGNTPEDGLWTEGCLKDTILPYPAGPAAFFPCNLFGITGGNASLGEQFSLVQSGLSSNWGVRREITETGYGSAYGDPNHKARFLLRQFLGYQAQGVTPVEFYRLSDPSAEDFGVVSNILNLHTPYLAYKSLAGLMSDIAGIKASPPAVFTTATLPSILSYAGTYPLDTVALIGAKSGDSKNSILFTLWQRSNGPKWGILPSPLAGAVTLEIPANMVVTKIVDLVSRASVPYNLSGQTLTLFVSDNPIEVLLSPLSFSGISLTSSASKVPVGSSVTLTCKETLANGVQADCATPSFASSNTYVARIQANHAVAEGVGVTTLSATVGSYVASTPLTVFAVVPTIAFNPIPAQVVGGPVFGVSATSPSFGAMTYSIVSGPARITGRLVQTTGAGTVVVKAAQAAAGNYAAAQAQTSFPVKLSTSPAVLILPANVVSNTLSLPNVAMQVTKKGSNWPTGTVEILDNDNTIWSYPLSANAHGSLGGITIAPMSAGTHNLSAYYAGDANYGPGASAVAAVKVVPFQSFIAGSCVNTKLAYGQPLSCTVTGTAGSAPLLGRVSYTVNGTSGTIALDAKGKAVLVMPNLPRGPGSLSLKYLPQGAYPGCPFAVNLNYTVN